MKSSARLSFSPANPSGMTGRNACPCNDPERLAALYALNILDTDYEERFDRLTRLMALSFDLPVAVISLVDADRVWFKSHHGLQVRELPIEETFCAHTICHKQATVIEDTRSSDLLSGSASTKERFSSAIRFYAGVTIRDSAGFAIGTCSLMDYKPGTLKATQIEQLKLFATLAEAEILRQTEQEKIKHHAVNSAYFDHLTGLPNQQLFLDRLEQALISISDSSLINVCVIHLCRFGELNQARGKEWADKVMFYTAVRLRGSLPISTTVARLEGAKLALFTVDKEGKGSQGNSHKTLARKVLELCEQEMRIGDALLHVQVKIGVSRYPETGASPDTLLEQAKSASKSERTINFYSEEQRSVTNRRFEVEQYLQRALLQNQFHVEYQPIVDIHSGELRSLEALLRLTVEDGPISPEEFIPIAEDTGLILPVGEWVIRAVCRQLGYWQVESPQFFIPVAINLASEQMGLKNLNSLILSAIFDNDLNHSQLQLEITETSLMKDVERAIRNMEEILKLGIDFSLDDFGTGYSSLSYLQKLPITKVKLDRAFIQHIDTNEHDRILAKNIINLCQELGKITVAEGIETQSQLDTLRELGCDLGQGYYFSRPLSTASISERIASKQLIFPATP